MTLSRRKVALLALLASPVGGVFAQYLATIVYRLATGTMSVGHLRWDIDSAIFQTLPLTFLIFTVGLLLVLIDISKSYWEERPPPRLWGCLLLGAVAGLLQTSVWAMGYHDADDYIGEVDPGWLGAMLRQPGFVLMMTLPGIASGATFWLVSRALLSQSAASD
jgi:hypothetical protein